MTAFLLIWDGSDAGYDPHDYAEDINRTARNLIAETNWSFGGRRSGTALGDRVFLLRQHTQRGIVASGHLTDGDILPGEHWDDPTKTAYYVNVAWDTVLAAQERLPTEELLSSVDGHNWNQVYASGQQLSARTEKLLEARWAAHLETVGRKPAIAAQPAPTDTAAAAEATVLCIWSSSSATGTTNLEFGLQNQTWGVKTLPQPGATPPRWVLFGHHHSAAGPRTATDIWNAGELDIVLCEYTTPFFTATAPLWPDEIDAKAVLYPHRFGITPLAHGRISASPTGPLGHATDALRRAGSANRGIHTTIDLQPLLNVLGIDLVTGTQLPDLSRTPGRATPDDGKAAARYATDPNYRHVVERHSVFKATEHMQSLGWTHVTELGKPYDLICRTPDGREKHVEVKGTSGAGGDVFYTPNEVHHFRTCPHGADLIVVRDITVDTTSNPYTTSGGELLHVHDYTAPPEDLQATQWSGRVTGWPS